MTEDLHDIANHPVRAIFTLILTVLVMLSPCVLCALWVR